MYKYEERGVWDKVRPIWTDFFKKSNGLVFVVDSSYGLEEAKSELDTFVSDKFVSPNVPILLLNIDSVPTNKDNVALDSTTEMPLLEMAEKLGLNDRMKNRPWQLRRVNINDISSCWDGIEWLVSKANL